MTDNLTVRIYRSKATPLVRLLDSLIFTHISAYSSYPNVFRFVAVKLHKMKSQLCGFTTCDPGTKYLHFPALYSIFERHKLSHFINRFRTSLRLVNCIGSTQKFKYEKTQQGAPPYYHAEWLKQIPCKLSNSSPASEFSIHKSPFFLLPDCEPASIPKSGCTLRDSHFCQLGLGILTRKRGSRLRVVPYLQINLKGITSGSSYALLCKDFRQLVKELKVATENLYQLVSMHQNNHSIAW